MAKLKATLKKTLDILTSSTHKEINIGARRQHDNIVQGLVRQLDKYFDPFSDWLRSSYENWCGN